MMFFLLFAITASSMGPMVSAKAADSVEALMEEGNNKFTAKMLNEVVKQNPGKNLIMSAYSVLTPLAQLMLAAAPGTDTHRELMLTIGMPNDDVTKEAFETARKDLRAVKGITLTSASRIYVANDLKLNPEYEAMSKNVFGSSVKNVDFSESAAAAKAVNDWVAKETNDRIKDLVNPDSFDKSTRAVLVNALYFKGAWRNKFDVAKTKDMDFHVSRDKTVKVPTMYQKNNMQYGESVELNAKLVEIPYAGDALLLVVLPNEVDGLPALEEKLKDPEALKLARSKMYTADVELYLPKFKVETKTDLKQVLEALGVTSMFSPSKAQLSKLINGGNSVYVSQAIQKAFIEVNEVGTEAAAANDIEIVLTATMPSPLKKLFKADRPFYFALDAERMKTTLFSGVISKPTSAK